MKKWECQEGIRSSMWGFYDYHLGASLNQVIMRHEPKIRDHYKQELNLDVKQII